MKNPLSVQKITQIILLLNIPIEDIVRTNEIIYKEKNLDQASEQEIMQSLIKYPNLLQRPIVIHSGKAVIARPAELCDQLFS